MAEHKDIPQDLIRAVSSYLPPIGDRLKIRGKEIKEQVEEKNQQKIKEIMEPIYKKIIDDILIMDNFKYKDDRMTYTYTINHCTSVKYASLINKYAWEICDRHLYKFDEFKSALRKLNLKVCFVTLFLFSIGKCRWFPYIVIYVYADM